MKNYQISTTESEHELKFFISFAKIGFKNVILVKSFRKNNKKLVFSCKIMQNSRMFKLDCS